MIAEPRAQSADAEATTRRAMLHMLEDLQRERDALRVAHEQWLHTVDAVRDPMVVCDAAGLVVRANRTYAERAAREVRDLIGRPYADCFPKREGALSRAGGEFKLESGEVFLCHAFPVAQDARLGHVLYLLEDVTQKRAAEHRIAVLNMLYATLSGVNHAIVHSKSRRELGERVVEASTRAGLWQAAWMGFVDASSQRVVPHAWSDLFAPHMKRIVVSSDAAIPEGRGPSGNAIRTGAPCFCDDVRSDPALAPWRDFHESYGIHSVAAIPLRIERSVAGVVVLNSREKDIFTEEVRALVREMGQDVSFALETLESERRRRTAEEGLAQQQLKLRRALIAMIETIAATVECRDPYTAGHQRRVADLARAIGKEMGLAESTLEGIHFGALIHDLGKIQIPAELLAKPTRLTKIEFELIKTHAQAGYDIVKGIDFPWPVAEMVHQHHERLDGSGYPQGLKGDAIAPQARILAVADVVEAMASHRPYRPGLGIEAALKEIIDKRGKWFDPAAVDACVRLFRERRFSFEAN